MCVRMCTRTCVRVVCMHVYMCVHAYMYVRIYACVHVCVRVYVCVIVLRSTMMFKCLHDINLTVLVCSVWLCSVQLELVLGGAQLALRTCKHILKVWQDKYGGLDER